MENQKNIQFLILKNNDINQPNVTVINQTTPQSEWKMFVPSEVNPSIQTPLEIN